MVSPLVLTYDAHVADPDRFVDVVAREFAMTPDQTARLSDYARNPDRDAARLNVGRSGRGREKVPADVREFLLDYARAFGDELTEPEIGELLG
jgi:hypothetical protein